MKEQFLTPISEQPLAQENKEQLYDGLFGLVGKTYKERLEKSGGLGLLADSLNHVKQVKDNADFIAGEIKAGRMKDEIIPKNAKGEVDFDEKMLKVLAILHDVAKIDEEGKLDTFYHHERGKLEKILAGEDSEIRQFLKINGFGDEEIKLLIDGIETHSRRTDFIYRKFAKEEIDLNILPRPEGVLEYVILSDADILTQSKLEQGVKKIVCNRLLNEKFRQQDTIEKHHSFAKTLESAVDSAQKVSEAMHFEMTKQKALGQIKQVREFEKWLNSNNRIQEIDGLDDFGLKKKRFDELVEEFIKNKQTPLKEIQ